MDIPALISSFGFPIVACGAMAWFVWTTIKDMRADFLSREGRLLDNNDKLALALDKSADAIQDANKQSEMICGKISTVETKVDDLHKKVDGLPRV